MTGPPASVECVMASKENANHMHHGGAGKDGDDAKVNLKVKGNESRRDNHVGKKSPSTQEQR